MESERSDTLEDADESLDNVEVDIWSQIVKKKSTREKYKNYVKIVESFTEQESNKKNRRSDDGADSEPPKYIKKYRFICKLCKKISLEFFLARVTSEYI